jgi:transposase InsO family protein
MVPLSDRKAIADALIPYRRENGQIPREHTLRVAEAYGINWTTVLRIVKEATEAADSKPAEAAKDSRQVDPFTDEVIYQALLQHGSIKGAFVALQKRGLPGKISAFYKRVKKLDQFFVKGCLGGWAEAIRHRIYANTKVVYRGQMFALDHRMANVRVKTRANGRVFRPWQTTVVDCATGVIVAFVVWAGQINRRMIRALMALIAHGRTYEVNGELVHVGGKPGLIRMDNQSSHLVKEVTLGAAAAGIVLVLTVPHHPFQNGSAEVSNQVHDRNEMRLPGSIRLKGITGMPLFAADSNDKQRLGTVVDFTVYERYMQQKVDEYNTTPNSSGLSPLDRWVRDNTEVEQPDPEWISTHMMPVSKKHKIYKKGISYKGTWYSHPLLDQGLFGREVDIRYLHGETDWIDAWDGDTFIARLWDPTAVGDEFWQSLAAVRREKERLLHTLYRADRERRDLAAAITGSATGVVLVDDEGAVSYLDAAAFFDATRDELLAFVEAGRDPDHEVPDVIPISGASKPARTGRTRRASQNVSAKEAAKALRARKQSPAITSGAEAS